MSDPTPPPNLSERLTLAPKLWLAAEILGTYVFVRRVSHGQQLPHTVAALRSRRVSHRTPLPLSDGARDGLQLGQAVTRTLSMLPMDTRCLMQSLVLLRLLARRRVQSSLVIAVLPTAGEDLTAHAWVELGGRALLDPGTEAFGRLLTL